MKVDKGSPIPLYYQVVQQVQEQIRLGNLQQGERLPSERELSEQFGISRMTLRQALSHLAREGWLTVHHGRGTFIAEPKLTFDTLHLMGFTETVLRQNGTVTSRVIEQGVVEPPAHVAEALRLRPTAPVVRIVRLRHVDGVPMALETSCLPQHLCRGLDQEDLSRQSLYTLLQERYGLPLQWARQTISATTASAYESDLFTVPEGIGMLLVEGLTFTRGDAPAEYFEVLYRGDRFKLSVSSDRHAGSGKADEPGLSVVLSQAGAKGRRMD